MNLFHQSPTFNPLPRADTIITDKKNPLWRICVLSTSLVRIEWSPDGVFENNPTQIVRNRDFGVTPSYTVRREKGRVVVETSSFRLTYDGQKFTREGLSCLVKTVGGNFNEWHYGDPATHGNLGGTARTLDEADGPVPLEDGLASKDGWAVLDDSASNEIVSMKRVRGHDNPFGTWVCPRKHEEEDVYVFAHGHDYRGAVADLYRLTGPTPLLPRFALGNWWSRFYPYTQESYEKLMNGFTRAGIPFSVGVIDMDWHKTKIDPKYGVGWTGYSWNRRLFPNPKGFLTNLHHMGLRVSLNDHPRDGMRAFEDDYPQAARDMGIDPTSGVPVSFDIADPKFVKASLAWHHRLQAQGVDFWWIDWQQGGVSSQKGLDPLWMLNYVFYADSGRGGHWPLIFSRWAGIGSHRFSIGFSGDSVISWKSLRFQPFFVSTAANVGYGWWSNDIGGHMMGVHDENLQARWYWFGAFSPINRLHSSASPFLDKDPRHKPEPYKSAMIRALRLRHKMIPYTYTMNWRAHTDGRPIIEPVYWTNPDNPRAYTTPDEYMFGSQLLVSPIVQPDDPIVHEGAAQTWLPTGDWFDLFDGRHYTSAAKSGRSITVWRSLNRIPVFAHAGGIIPLQNLPTGKEVNTTENPHSLRVLVFPGENGRFNLVEDDGVFQWNDSDMKKAITPLVFDWTRRTFTIKPATGFPQVIPADREWTIVFRGVANPMNSKTSSGRLPALVNGRKIMVHADYDPSTFSLSVNLGQVGPTGEAHITLPSLKIAGNPMVDDAFQLLSTANLPYYTSETLLDEIRGNGRGAVAALDALEIDPEKDSGVRATYERGLIRSHVPAAVASALTEILLRS